MTVFLNWVTAAFQISLAVALCSGQTVQPETSSGTSSDNAGVSKFVGLWSGTFSSPNGNTNYPMMVEIRSGQGRELIVQMEWSLLTNRIKTSGPGLVTANCASWVELEASGQTTKEMFGRYMANLVTNNQLNGKYFLETNLEESGSFVLGRTTPPDLRTLRFQLDWKEQTLSRKSAAPVRKTDPEKLKAFRSKNDQVLERLLAASRDTGFLAPAWTNVCSLSVLWLKETLGANFAIVDDAIVPDLQYASDLSAALEKRQNFFVDNLGAEIPLSLNRLSDPSVKIKAYRLSFPKDFPDGKKKYPVLIELHGGGDTRRRIHFDVPKSTRETPFIIVKPHSEINWQSESLNLLFAEIKRFLPIDEERVYLRGASMGGTGTWKWAMDNPELFAAISPMCGRADVFRSPRLRNVPIWIFHGEKDEVSPFWYSGTMVGALQSSGANVKFSFYPEAGHSISQLIDYNELDQWLLQHKRSKEPISLDPLDDLKLGDDAIGERKFITLSRQRFASIQLKSAGPFHLDWGAGVLYGICKSAGVTAHEMVQEQTLPELPHGAINLLLAIPTNLDAKELPAGVNLIETPPCHALSFAIRGEAVGVHLTPEAERSAKPIKDDALIRSILENLKEHGRTPTGEIRKTVLLSDSQSMERIKRIQILLR